MHVPYITNRTINKKGVSVALNKANRCLYVDIDCVNIVIVPNFGIFSFFETF